MGTSGSTQEIWTKLQAYWTNLSLGRRVAAITAVVGLAVAGMGFLTWSQTPDYATLFASMDERDQAEVVTKLKDGKIPYQISGGTIKVPSNKVDEVRLQLAADGLPKGGSVGFELFDQTNLAMTDFAQRLNYQRALEGELARTIGQLAPVASARVHLVMPQPQLYKDKEQETTASVVLNLRPGRSLDEKQVRAVANLVAGSVEGLKPANLTIVDTAGNVLSDGQAEASAPGRLSSNQIELQQAYEKAQESRVRTLLDGVLGPGKAAVRVSAQLDWDQVEQNNELYAPNGMPNQLRSVREVRESQPAGGATAAGGIPGTASNVPGYVGTTVGATPAPKGTATPAAKTPTPAATASATAAATVQAAANTERVETTQNYEISKTVERVTRAPGSVKRLSVALIVDEGLAPEKVDAINKSVAAAVGLDPNRGDVISVNTLPFDKSGQTQDTAQTKDAQQMELYRTLAMAASAVVAVLLLAIFLRRLTGALVGNEKPKGKKGKARVQQVTPSLPGVTADELAYQQQIAALAKAQPQTLALLLQDWVEEKR